MGVIREALIVGGVDPDVLTKHLSGIVEELNAKRQILEVTDFAAPVYGGSDFDNMSEQPVTLRTQEEIDALTARLSSIAEQSDAFGGLLGLVAVDTPVVRGNGDSLSGNGLF